MPDVRFICQKCHHRQTRSSNCHKCRCGGELRRTQPGEFKIVKLELQLDTVTITLSNSVRIALSSNEGHVHLHFANIAVDVPIRTPVVAGNYLDVHYVAATES